MQYPEPTIMDSGFCAYSPRAIARTLGALRPLRAPNRISSRLSPASAADSICANNRQLSTASVAPCVVRELSPA
jgi:hypothetical protein